MAELVEETLKRIQRSTVMPAWHSSIFRMLLGTYILLFSASNFSWINDVPQSFFNPAFLSISRLFSGFPPAELLIILDILIILFALFISLGVRSRFSSLAFLLVYIFGNSFRYSFGKIDHGGVMLMATLLCFSFSDWGTQNALLPDKPSSFHPLSSALLGILLSFGMFTAGFEKLLSWVDFDLSTNGFLDWFYNGYFSLGRQELLASSVFHFPPLLLEVLDYSAVIFELSPFLCLIAGPLFWRSWLVLASVFHLANTSLLNIVFITHVPIYCAYFLYPLLEQTKLKKHRHFRKTIRFTYFFTVIISTLHIVLRLSGNGVNSLLILPYGISQLWLSIVLWAGVIILGVLSLLHHRKKPLSSSNFQHNGS
ncbi:hypothetical protein [Acaryochloris sp. IP29b_bin.137]|uniref:hypothetical protein n=1 Tax=Acaryochloris sp. IP29b_bin.137 TaxID=2969217 RepID=UPI0026339BF9|nr:hypothetical protein [Acaryochloris sp. IP29b_bin.137]